MSKPNAQDYNRIMDKQWADVPKDQKFNVWQKYAATYCRAMWKKHTGRKLRWPIRYGTGNRNTWVRRGVLTINPSSGWEHVNHDFSHLIERHTTGLAHSAHHLEIERDGALMIKRRFLTTEPDPDVRIPKKRDKPNRTWRVIAQELDIEIEVDPFGGGGTWGIWPPKGLFENEEDDPYHWDGHYTHCIKDARLRVLDYAEIVSSRQ